MKTKKILFFSAKVSVIVITALAFISCGGAGGSGSGGSTSAVAPDLNVTLNATNDSGTIEFQATITNNSSATVDIALIQLHRNEVIIATSDQKIKLASNQFFIFSTTDTPSEPNNYSYKFCVQDDAISNNNFCSNESSFALFPELSISLRSNIEFINPSSDFNLTIEITNDGNRFSPPTHLDIFRSLSDTFDTSSNIFTTPIGDLSTDESVSVIRKQQEANEGIYFYRACVRAVLGERNINNNCSERIKIEVFTMADLSIDTIGVSSTDVEAGSTLSISTQISNIGLEDASAVTIQFYRSSDITISTADILITSVSVDTLSIGESIDVEVTAIGEIGRFYYGACVERVGLRENISNNCSYGISVNGNLLWEQATGSAAWSDSEGHTSLVYDNKMWVLGGNAGSRRNDVWHSTDGVNWEQATASAGWSARASHTSLAYDNKMWVLGGFDVIERKNDVWYSTDGVNWVQATADAAWSGRDNHTSLVYDNKMWVLGGYDGSHKNDVWYSTNGINWVQVIGNADWSGRYGHTSLVYDNKMWVIGGNDFIRENDVWYSIDGINWVQVTGDAGWSSREFHTSLIYDNKMWVLGGNDGSYKNDVWYSTDGINWEQATASADWSDRNSHTSLVYDNRMWLLGGDDGNNKNDVWFTFIQDSTNNGIELALGEKVNSLLAADEKEYYSLQLSSGSYQIATEGSTNTLCSLYNASNELLVSDNNGGVGENCSFIFSTSTTEDVYLRVQGANSGITGGYSLTIVPIAPDVNIRSLDIGHLGINILYEEEDFQITTEIQNIGISTADNITIKYYFSQNSQINPTADTPDSISNITNLRAEAIVTHTSSITRINSAGFYYYGVCLETANELNLANNCLFHTTTIYPKPDIIVSFSAPSIVYLDDAKFRPQVTLINQGWISEPIVFNYYKSPTAFTIPDNSNLISSSDIAVYDLSTASQFSKIVQHFIE